MLNNEYNLITQIIQKVLKENIINDSAIEGFGTVNQTYQVTTPEGNYILRLNEGKDSFDKLRWAIDQGHEEIPAYVDCAKNVVTWLGI